MHFNTNDKPRNQIISKTSNNRFLPKKTYHYYKNNQLFAFDSSSNKFKLMSKDSPIDHYY